MYPRAHRTFLGASALALHIVLAAACAAKAASEELPAAEEPPKARVLFNKGHKAMDRHDLRKAEELYRKAIDLAPDQARYHRQLCLLLLRMGRPQEARREALIALSVDSQDWRSMILLGNIYNLEKRYEEELGLYRKAIKLIPEQEKSIREQLRQHIAQGELALKEDLEREKKKKELEEAQFRNLL